MGDDDLSTWYSILEKGDNNILVGALSRTDALLQMEES
jgi:hypothetical protein